MLEAIENYDLILFKLINSNHSIFFDIIMFYFSKTLFWLPLYLFLAFVLIKQFKKKSFIIFALIALLLGATDQTSVLIKNTIKRYRPSHNLKIQNSVHTYKNERGGLYGFVSSHAANTAGVAFFLSLIPVMRRYLWLLTLWVFLVCYSRIYLGLHYPSDIIGGIFVGIIIAIIVRFIFIFIVNKVTLNKILKE
ncbi:MAG: phosphatase PAP2 family protein [Bacteroidales bacterium]|nr:phosphatase PAP2 family protein [Bacteroidales bacterium]